MSAPAATTAKARERKSLQCRHCGTALSDETMRKSGFCCYGCAYVFSIVHEHGLDGYYRIKDALTPPVDAVVFQTRDFSWLSELQQKAETKAGEGTPSAIVGIQGISCAGCVWLIEKLFQQMPGARQINVNAQLGDM